jgi:hypothetical protein
MLASRPAQFGCDRAVALPSKRGKLLDHPSFAAKR